MLVNNAGIALLPKDDPSENRDVWTRIIDTNVVSTAAVTQAFIPLLKSGLVINVSSARASLARLSSSALPPTISIPYGVSKAALNALTLEMGKTYPEVRFECVNPGHCKTAFNGFRGARDPREGAEVVSLLVEQWLHGEGEGSGFWETVGDEGVLRSVPW